MNFNKAPELILQEDLHKEESSLLQKMGELSPQIVSFLALLSASNAVFAADLEANTVRSKVENAIVSAEDSRLEVSPEVDAVTRERFGVSIYDVCEQTGCQILVEKPSTNGKYIIHMGQVHVRPPIEMLLSGGENIVLDSQQIIFDSLNLLQKPTVIEEGNTRYIRPVPKTKEEAENMILSDDVLIDSNHFGVKERQDFIINRFGLDHKVSQYPLYFFSEGENRRLEEISKTDVTAIDNENMREMLSELQGRLHTSTFKYKGEKMIKYKTPFAYDIQKSAVFALGAAYTLQLSGKEMNVLPGETIELNNAVGMQLSSAGIPGSAYYEAQENRDDYAVNAAVQSRDVAPIIVYGAAHGFIGNLDKNDASEYGVIRIRTSYSSDVIQAEGSYSK